MLAQPSSGRGYAFSMPSFKAFFVCTLILLLQGSLFGQGWLRADGQRIVNDKGENVLLRGVGLGGWMLQEGYMLKIYKDAQQHLIRQRIETLIGPEKTAAFYNSWLVSHTTRADIDSLKSWGFNSVRLPMHYNLYTLPADREPVAGENTWLDKGFQLTDSLLSWCKANEIYLILDLHAAPGGQGNDLNISDRDNTKPSLWQSEANQQKTVALWRKLAERYAGEPWIGAYDIINEPNWGFDDLQKDPNGLNEKHNAPLRKLMVDITSAIREADQKHLIIIEGNGWGNNYNGIMPAWDNNMALSFHKYWNNNDENSIRHILNMRKENNMPVWLGETGENSNVWFTQAIALLENNNIGWAWWPLKKLGNNNPLEIKSNPAYEKVVNYFNDKGSKPSADEAYKGLTQLAADLKTSRNIYHHDVTDAMFRQPFSDKAIPFRLFVVKGNTTINAVDYDLGKNGIAYLDNDTADYHISGKPGAGNKGHVYRNDGVDIKKDKTSDSYYVYSTEKGEWVQYTIEVKKAGNYQVKLMTEAEKPGGKISIYADEKNIGTGTQSVTSADWKIMPAGMVNLSAGQHVIKVYIDEGGAAIKSIQLTLH